MIDDIPVHDADAHVLEPNELWAQYLAPQFSQRISCQIEGDAARGAIDFQASARLHVACLEAGVDPQLISRILAGTSVGARCLRLDGQPIFEGISDEVWRRGVQHTLQHCLPALARRFDAPSQIANLRERGVDCCHLYPTTGLWLFAIAGLEPALAGALVAAYNDWLFDYCSQGPGFLRGVAAVCQHDPSSMPATVAWAAEHGWGAVYVRPNPFGGRTLSHPAYEPFWAECERRNVAVAIHEGTHARLPAAGADRFVTRFGRHACSHPLEQMMALLSLIEGGVLERHPKLRVAFMESGCGWLPYWLWRLDTIEYQNLAWEVPQNVRMKPSDYFRRQCFIACEASEPGLELVVKELGASCLLYGSDYPHMDHAAAIASDVEQISARLGRVAARELLWNNPRRFYGCERPLSAAVRE